MYLKQITGIFEKSTQYYYFSDKIMDVIGKNDKVYNFVSDWLFSKGPGSDERYRPDLTFQDYLDVLSPEEIQYLEKMIKKKFSNLLESEDKEDSKEPEEKKPKKSYPVVAGTLIKITNFGTDKEPRKQMWNNARAEVLAEMKDGSFKVRITDVKEANVLFSKKWYDNEQGALKQRLILRRDEFKTLQEIEDEENSK